MRLGRQRLYGLVSVLVLLIVAFVAGRWSVAPAGSGLPAAEPGAAGMNAAGLRKALDSQSRELAALEVGRRVDRESLLEAQRMIGELQSQVARLNQDLEFHRGVLAKEFGAGSVRLQSVVVRGRARGGFQVEVTMVRAAVRDTPVQGATRITLSGRRQGALVEVPLRDLSSDRRREIPFVLRYFQTLHIPITVPGDLEPEAITAELLLAPGARVVDRRTVSWTVAP